MARLRLSAGTLGLTVAELNKVVQAKLNDRKAHIEADSSLRQEVAFQFGLASTPFVPKKKGTLRRSMQVTNDGRLIWSARPEKGHVRENYAPIRYNNEARHYTTPDTHAHWTEYVNMPEFYEQITPILVEAVKRG